MSVDDPKRPTHLPERPEPPKPSVGKRWRYFTRRHAILAGFILGGVARRTSASRGKSCRGTGLSSGKRRCSTQPPGDHRNPVCASADLQLEALFLDRELRQLRTLHEFDDLLDLFEVQRVPWLWS